MASKVCKPDVGHPRHGELHGAVVQITKTKGFGIRRGQIQLRVKKATGEVVWLEPMTLAEYQTLNPSLETAKVS